MEGAGSNGENVLGTQPEKVRARRLLLSAVCAGIVDPDGWAVGLGSGEVVFEVALGATDPDGLGDPLGRP